MVKLITTIGFILLFLLFLGVSIYYFSTEHERTSGRRMEVTIPITPSPSTVLVSPPVSSISGTIDTTRSSIQKDDTTSSSQLNN